MAGEESVTETITLYGGDADAMRREWSQIKQGDRRFDIVDFNCAKVVWLVLAAGFQHVCPSLRTASDWISPRGVFDVAQSIAAQYSHSSLPRLQLLPEQVRSESLLSKLAV